MAEPLDELYAAPLDAFVATRGRLAKSLAEQGDKAGAAEVKAARKPTTSAWLVNQIARAEPGVVKDLLKASADVVHAQLDAAGGAEERERLVRALERQREVEDELKEAVRALVARPTADIVSRVLDDFRRGALDPESRQLLRVGRLTRDLPARDFGALLEQLSEGRPAPVRKPRPTAAKKPKAVKPTARAREGAERARKVAEAAERTRKAAEAARKRKADDVARRRAQVEARKVMARAERRVDDLRAELEEAEGALEEARASLARAE